MEILKVTGLTKNFGSLQAVGGVSLSVQKNEIRAIIGPNGAANSLSDGGGGP
jgi:ABC-type branched-subunit amino acid transport system ATPase component